MSHGIASSRLATIRPLCPRCAICGGPRSYGRYRYCFPCRRQRQRDMDRDRAAILRRGRERRKLAAEQAAMDQVDARMGKAATR